MPRTSARPVRRSDKTLLTTVTALISRSGHEHFIAEEFERAFAADPDRTRHLAALLIQQEDGISFLVSQFAGEAALRDWRESASHHRMIDAFEAHSLRELCTIARPVARLRVPSAGSGPKWQTLVVGWVITTPLLFAVLQVLGRLLPRASPAVNIAVTSLVMSIAITWLISPAVLRITRIWRLRNQQMHIVVIGDADNPGAVRSNGETNSAPVTASPPAA